MSGGGRVTDGGGRENRSTDSGSVGVGGTGVAGAGGGVAVAEAVGIAGVLAPVLWRRSILIVTSAASLNVGIASSREQLCPNVTNQMGQLSSR